MPASSIIYVGNTLATLLEDVPSTIEYDKDGIAGATLNYTVLWANGPGLVGALNKHPDFSWMIRDSATITRMEAKWAKVSVKFKGIDPEKGNTSTYSVRGSTSQEPIESHPEFATFAGKWWDRTTWAPGAEFKPKGDKDEGRFLGFKLEEGGEKNKKAGIKSFLEGGMVFRETKNYVGGSGGHESVDLDKLGYIDTPPKVSQFVDFDGDRDWILITCSVEEVGEGIKATKEWRLSGREGWDTDIYTKA